MKSEAKNWTEWIQERFGDTNRYVIKIDKKDNRIYTISSAKADIESEICFLIMNLEDPNILYDIQFSEHDRITNETWVSPFTVDPEYEPKASKMINEGFMHTSLFYTQDFIERLEKEWLYIPLKKG